jgi:hypothetical protein
MNDKEKLASIENLKRAADKAKEENYEGKIEIRDVILDILIFFLRIAIAFGWMMLMLLLISFVSLGYLHFKIESMVIVAVVTAVIVGVHYIYKMVVKYRK